ncbi:helix-turn-helix domain-containing protein [Williamsia deligens]|uniref:Helix-turn-helix domain-containing protein n=1 Tax=Williamsia deligens TaxID=321325 RepID=A0ABW3G6P3_9NOCA|nr:helix-turn-helix domain-containing protein [Williamsia deligens]MCP2193362.1 DNA-binding transcriptional regulator, IclR family [Williamsia deligens]
MTPDDVDADAPAPADPSGRDPSPPTTRVVAVMQMLSAAPDRSHTLAQICRASGISRATGHAVLRSLCAHDWVRRRDDGTYSLGPGFAGSTAGSSADPLHRLLADCARDVGMAVSATELRGATMVVTHTVRPPVTGTDRGSVVPEGVSIPFVAPFGREHVATVSPEERERWWSSVPPGAGDLRHRLDAVLSVVAARGFAIDRLSGPLVRVHAALDALGETVGPDRIATAMAGAFAELEVVDVLDGELGEGDTVAVATVAAAISGSGPPRSVAIQPFTRLSPTSIRRLGATVTELAAAARSVS